MVWREVSVESQRLEFARLAGQPGANVRALCRRWRISAPTGYKWLERFREEGAQGLSDRSRRPTGSPQRTDAELEARVVALRDAYPAWGGRKLRKLLQNEASQDVPSASTITEILRRHERLDPARAGKPGAWQRFEHAEPNQLWQMDFKGHFPLVDRLGSRCHALTVLDDHSRYLLGLRACDNEREGTVQQELTAVFRRYGLPLRMTADNGAPWGNSGGSGPTALGAWIIRLGIRLGHSRPHHPQTQGKDERVHRTLELELLTRTSFDSTRSAQSGFDAWQDRYNHVRPHEALAMETPASRYRPSPRAFPEDLPVIAYDSQDQVRKVQSRGEISFRGRHYRVGSGLVGLPVALRGDGTDGGWEVYFCHQKLGRINLKARAEDRVQANGEAGLLMPL